MSAKKLPKRCIVTGRSLAAALRLSIVARRTTAMVSPIPYARMKAPCIILAAESTATTTAIIGASSEFRRVVFY